MNIRLVVLLLLFNSIIHNSGAQNLTKIDITSNELKHHVFDQLTSYPIWIYLPPSYQNTNVKFPVLYFLPGYSCGYFNKNTLIQEYHNDINSGNLKEMIVVFIEGCTKNSDGCFYLNSEATGNWEDFIVNNVVNYIDENYRTINKPSSRAIAGHSMGGFGAINLAMLHPDVFGSLYSHSPGLFSETGLEDCQMFKNKSNIEAFIALKEELDTMTRNDAHEKLLERLKSLNEDLRFTIDYGVAVAPNLDKNAPYIDFPYAKINDTLKINDTIWKKWEKGFGGLDNEVPLYKNNFLSLDTIVIDYGTGDFYTWIPEGCIYMSAILSSNEIPHKLVSYSGGHSNLSRYKTQMFPIFMNSLVFDTALVNITNKYSSNLDNICIFPNPGYDRVQVHLPFKNNGNCVFEIVNINGQLVRKGLITDGQHIDLSDLSDNLYTLRVVCKGMSYSAKLLVNKKATSY